MLVINSLHLLILLTTLVNLTQFIDKLTYLNATRKLEIFFLICNFVRFYTIIGC